MGSYVHNSSIGDLSSVADYQDVHLALLLLSNWEQRGHGHIVGANHVSKIYVTSILLSHLEFTFSIIR